MTTTKIHPSVYVGTYAKYNNRDLSGEWLYLGDYTKESFYAKCREIHSDEEDPELMFQDRENDPCNYIGEYFIKDELWKFIEQTEGWDEERIEAYREFIDYYGEDDIETFEDKYQGKWDSEESFAENLVEQCYNLEKMMGGLAYYFDYEKFARDLFINDYYMSNGHVFSCH